MLATRVYLCLSAFLSLTSATMPLLAPWDWEANDPNNPSRADPIMTHYASTNTESSFITHTSTRHHTSSKPSEHSTTHSVDSTTNSESTTHSTDSTTHSAESTTHTSTKEPHFPLPTTFRTTTTSSAAEFRLGGSSNSTAPTLAPSGTVPSNLTVTPIATMTPLAFATSSTSTPCPYELITSPSSSSSVTATTTTPLLLFTTPGPSTTTLTPLPYATAASYAAFIPCLEGTFLCSSTSTFLQCTTSTTYVDMGAVADGMQCMPASVANDASADGTDGLQLSRGGGAVGTHRDDLVVRADPLGECAVDGTRKCLLSGQSWAMCAQGVWIDMGPLAVGTLCQGAAGSAEIVGAGKM